MVNEIISEVINKMNTHLTNEQLKKLRDVLQKSLKNYQFEKVNKNELDDNNNNNNNNNNNGLATLFWTIFI